MTTEKKSNLSERMKALRDKIVGVMAAAEEEEASVAGPVLPEETPAQEPGPAKPERDERASDDEIASALRRFTWESPEQEKVPDVNDLLRVFMTPAEDAPDPSEEKDPGLPALSPETASEEGPVPAEADEEEEPAEYVPGSKNEEPEEPEKQELEERDAEEHPEDPDSVFSGIAAILAQLRETEDRDAPEALEQPGDIPAEMEEAGETEPDPEDVAKLWEPHQGKPEPEPEENLSGTDADREDTHVFTKEDLKDLPHDEAQGGEELLLPEDEDDGYTPRDFHPIRRRRYYRSGIAGGIMYFLFVVCVSMALAAFGWLAADDVLSLNKEYMEAEVYVGEDMDLGQVATELHTKGLIRYRKLFEIFGKLFHAEEKIEPGTYTLSTKLDYRALITNMHHYTGWVGEEPDTVIVTIPEGKTVMETFQILADHGVCPYETLMECAAQEEFDYAFLAGIPDGDATRLEGYLFPDTYEFYAESSPKAAICRFLDNFGERIPERVTEQAAELGYSLRQVLIVASLIEREAGNDSERPTIASVIYNRLQSTSYPYLQIDATIQYAMGEHKERLSYEDLEVDSPYNTYKYPGLPPGPICNPGLASVRAALNPENTGYYFYALNKNGLHQFFSSYNEFQRFINSANFGG